MENEKTKDLTKGVLLGEKWAFEQLYRKSYPMVESWIVNNSGTRDQAQDVFQEALIVMVNNLRKKEFKFTALPSTFIFAIAKRIWLKNLRKLKSSKEDLSLDEDNKIEAKDQDMSLLDFEFKNIPDHPMHQLVINCMTKLGDKCKAVIRSKHVLGMSHKEIAEELNINEGTSKSQLAKAKQTLRDLHIKHNRTYAETT